LDIYLVLSGISYVKIKRERSKKKLFQDLSNPERFLRIRSNYPFLILFGPK